MEVGPLEDQAAPVEEAVGQHRLAVAVRAEGVEQLQRRCDVVGPQVGDHHLHAGVEQRARDAEADAACAAGDERRATLELLHVRQPPDRPTVPVRIP